MCKKPKVHKKNTQVHSKNLKNNIYKNFNVGPPMEDIFLTTFYL